MSQIGVLSTGRRRQASRKRCDIEVAMYHGIRLGGRPARDVSRGQDRRGARWGSGAARPPLPTRPGPPHSGTRLPPAGTEERRVGEEGEYGGVGYHLKK